MTFLYRLFTGCFRHEDHYERDPDLRLHLVCGTCGSRRPVLASVIVRGPQAEPSQVLGACKAKAFPEKVEHIEKRKRA